MYTYSELSIQGMSWDNSICALYGGELSLLTRKVLENHIISKLYTAVHYFRKCYNHKSTPDHVGDCSQTNCKTQKYNLYVYKGVHTQLHTYMSKRLCSSFDFRLVLARIIADTCVRTCYTTTHEHKGQHTTHNIRISTIIASMRPCNACTECTYQCVE